ncbi:hypothetical protein K474DRAFT_1773585, partial [Panus rudis PR-1116 ss-1]
MNTHPQMTIFIGDLQQEDYASSHVRNIHHSRETVDIRNGEIVQFFGHAYRWDENCISSDICLQWRRVNDPLCDSALELVFPIISSSVGKDLLKSLRNHIEESPAGSNAASELFEQINGAPPEDIAVSGSEMELGRTLFLDHAVPILQALLHYSLAAGFASSRITRTLHAISYLVPPKNTPFDSISEAANERTYIRLLETVQFVLDVMACSVPPSNPSLESKADLATHLMPGGEGWKSAVRVRLLHGVARRRARQQLSKLDIYWNPEDVPISQEDMVATLAAFSTIPLWCLSRMPFDLYKKRFCTKYM